MSKKQKETPILADEMLSKSEVFVQKYKKAIIGITLAIILVVGGMLAYNSLVAEPKENEAPRQYLRSLAYRSFSPSFRENFS